jgi:hypothetical protein
MVRNKRVILVVVLLPANGEPDLVGKEFSLGVSSPSYYCRLAWRAISIHSSTIIRTGTEKPSTRYKYAKQRSNYSFYTKIDDDSSELPNQMTKILRFFQVPREVQKKRRQQVPALHPPCCTMGTGHGDSGESYYCVFSSHPLPFKVGVLS